MEEKWSQVKYLCQYVYKISVIMYFVFVQGMYNYDDIKKRRNEFFKWETYKECLVASISWITKLKLDAGKYSVIFMDISGS